MKRMPHVLSGLLVLIAAIRADAAGFAMSDNFTVFTPAYATDQDNQAYAQEVLRCAEMWRREIAREWLGEELPPSIGKTTVNVAFSEDRDAGLTWAKDDRHRAYHTLYMTTTPDRALGSTLAHEMVHVVLATRFPDPRRLPAWVEEGVASRYDDPARHTTRQQILSWMAKTGNWSDVETVMLSVNISTHDKAAYATASSITEFLLSRGDKHTLFEFGLHGTQSGWDTALERFYRIRSTAHLQRAWQQWVKQSL
jgi:hypothetical protein